MASTTLRRVGATLWIWYLVPLHLLSALIFTLLMIVVLDGATFLPCDSAISWPKRWSSCGLSQTDTTSLISAGLVIQRLLTSSWLTQSGWISMYILLEKEGLRLDQAARLAEWHWPSMTASVKKTYGLAVLLVSLLLLPPQYIAPLASGSVTWNPIYLFTNGTSVEITAANMTSLYWQSLFFQEHRFALSVGAAARSVQIQDNDMFTNNTQGEIHLRRRLSSLKNFANRTTLENVTMPYISIDSFNWIPPSNFSTVPTWVTQVLNANNLTLDFSTGQSPSRITSEGTATVPKPATFSKSSWYSNLPKTPPPIVYSGEKYVTMLVRRINNVCSCPDWSPTFGSIQNLVVYDIPSYYSDGSCFADSCFAIAKMKITAGNTICRNCQLTQSGVIELRSSSPKKDGVTVQPDPWVDVIFDMLPEVMSLMTVMNTTDAQEFNNPEGYLRGFVSQAYQSSWNSIVDLFAYSEVAGNQYTVSTMASVPHQAIQASISKQRMIAWFFINLLLTIAGVVLIVLQHWGRNSRRGNVSSRNFVIDALLASPSELLEVRKSLPQNSDAMEDMKVISEPDERFDTLRLRLVSGHHGDADNSQGSYRRVVRNESVLGTELDNTLLKNTSEQWEMRSRSVSTEDVMAIKPNGNEPRPFL